MENLVDKNEFSQILINDIIEEIDEYLIEKRRKYISLTYANELLISKGIFSKYDQQNKILKKILELGLIANSSQTEEKPKQWRIQLSEKGKQKYGEVRKSGNMNKQQIINQSSESWYNQLNERQKKGFKRFIFIIAASIIIIVVNILPDNGSQKSHANSSLINQLSNNYIGKRYDMDVADELYEKYGYPETLNGTNNDIWIVYYPKGNFTMYQTKGNHLITKFHSGKKPSY
jgi:hypothetical protein